ncbi:MAG: GxxExxY protein [Acidobacteria bacterium]|nr:GxxExxY protein [Acidobacteriota bacterium]
MSESEPNRAPIPFEVERGLTKSILVGANSVHAAVGPGLPPEVYRNAMAVELRNQKIKFEQNKPFEIRYLGQTVGLYVAELVVNDAILVEVSIALELTDDDDKSIHTHLTMTRLSLGLILNFGRSRPHYRRILKTIL